SVTPAVNAAKTAISLTIQDNLLWFFKHHLSHKRTKTMIKTPSNLPLFLVVWALLSPIVPSASADDHDKIESIRYGLKALAFSSGSIQQSTPVDGIVNVVTGDNQTTGDRMIVGQKETIYLRLKNPDEASVGDYFTIYKRARKVFHPASRQYLGYLIYRLAIVEVVQ